MEAGQGLRGGGRPIRAPAPEDTHTPSPHCRCPLVIQAKEIATCFCFGKSTAKALMEVDCGAAHAGGALHITVQITESAGRPFTKIEVSSTCVRGTAHADNMSMKTAHGMGRPVLHQDRGGEQVAAGAVPVHPPCVLAMLDLGSKPGSAACAASGAHSSWRQS